MCVISRPGYWIAIKVKESTAWSGTAWRMMPSYFRTKALYVDISDLVELHVTEKSDAKTTKETLKWVHIAISNAKRTLLGNYHKIKRKYLQLYLNEFIYKLNRRYFGDKLFDRLVIANITGA